MGTLGLGNLLGLCEVHVVNGLVCVTINAGASFAPHSLGELVQATEGRRPRLELHLARLRFDRLVAMSGLVVPWRLGAVSRNSLLQRDSKRRFLLELNLADGLCDVGRMLRRGLQCLHVVAECGCRWRQSFSITAAVALR